MACDCRLILWTLLAVHISAANAQAPIVTPALPGIDPVILQLMNERDRQYSQRFEAQEKAIDRAKQESEKRFDSVNEFRSALKDQQLTFATKSEVAVQIKSITDRTDANSLLISALTTRLDQATGSSSGMSQLVSIATTIGGLLLGIIGTVVLFRRKPDMVIPPGYELKPTSTPR